jgi:hypothetical protein
VRDVALGAGALRALELGDARELRAWVTSHAVCDLADLIATWSDHDDLRASGVRKVHPSTAHDQQDVRPTIPERSRASNPIASARLPIELQAQGVSLSVRAGARKGSGR